MATKLKVITDHADIVPAPKVPDFTPAPTRKRRAGWTAARQRSFVEADPRPRAYARTRARTR